MTPEHRSDSKSDTPDELRTRSASPVVDGAALTRLLSEAVDATNRENVSETTRKFRTQLKQVASQYAGEDLDSATSLAAMVSVVTGDFQGLSETQQNELNAAVASSMYEDAACRARLEQLWMNLQQEVS